MVNVNARQVVRLKLPAGTLWYPHYRGRCYAELGEHRAAIEDMTEGFRLEPDHPNFFYNRAISYSELGEHIKAVEDYTDAIRIRADDADAYHNRAISYKELGMDLESRRDLRRSKELGVSNSGTRR